MLLIVFWLIVWLFDCLIDWLIEWSMEWLIDWLMDGSFKSSDWLIVDWLFVFDNVMLVCRIDDLARQQIATVYKYWNQAMNQFYSHSINQSISENTIDWYCEQIWLIDWLIDWFDMYHQMQDLVNWLIDCWQVNIHWWSIESLINRLIDRE